MIKYLKTFFEEKDLPHRSWSLLDKSGTPHIISNDVVIESIGQAPSHEQEGIADTIRLIDFHDGDVNDYLKHLAGALINS